MSVGIIVSDDCEDKKWVVMGRRTEEYQLSRNEKDKPSTLLQLAVILKL
ncbi:MAG: hypothetical protein ACFE9O_00300 [Promethearchaeota archaeon]